MATLNRKENTMQPTLFERIGAYVLDAFAWIAARLWVLVLLIGILMAGYILAKPVHAQPACQHGTVEAMVADLKAEVPDAAVVVYIGPDAQNVIAQYNSLPPVSTYAGDAATVVIHPSGPAMIVIVERKGCIVDAGLISVNAMHLPPPSRGKGV